MNSSLFPEADLKKGQALINQGVVDLPLFAKGTYQVQIWESIDRKGEGLWPYFHIDDHGKILDRFCPCEAAEKSRTCEHLAAAYLSSIAKNGKPLHVVFGTHFWHVMAWMAFRRFGRDVSLLEKSVKGEVVTYTAKSLFGKPLFTLKTSEKRHQKFLSEWIESRPAVIEDYALRFMNVSDNEKDRWNKSVPTPEFCFDISVWGDIGKYLFTLQEQGHVVDLTFSEGRTHLPDSLTAVIDGIEVLMVIAEGNWDALIPSLSTMPRSPLKVYRFARRTVRDIVYNEEKRQFEIRHQPNPDWDPKVEAIGLARWFYVPGKGFFPKSKNEFFEKSIIPAEEIGDALDNYGEEIASYLQGVAVFEEAIKLHYSLVFQSDLSLHIVAYHKKKGDLSLPGIAIFDDRLYIPGKGFYRLENLKFPAIDTVVAPAQLTGFLSSNRVWLSSLEGFQIHMSSIESHFTFELNETKKVLKFETILEKAYATSDTLDLGDWVYIKGTGFYAKTTSKAGGGLRSGLEVPYRDIPKFLDTHHDELELVSGFFNPTSPIKRAGLNVWVDEKEVIHVSPKYEYTLQQLEGKVLFFGHYTYTQGEGFCALDPSMILPQPYTKEMKIDDVAAAYFLSHELDRLENCIINLDPKLQKPSRMHIQVNRMRPASRGERGRWMCEMEMVTDLGRITPYEIWKGLTEKKHHLYTSAGLLLLDLPRFKWLIPIKLRRFVSGGTELKISTLDWLRLSVAEDIHRPYGDSKAAKESRKILDQIENFQTVEAIDLTGLESRLRPYQETGLSWLWFLYCHGLSGLLCDDMGLGKTHQAMALLAAARNSQQEKKGKYLVICPTSVLFHWEDLLKKFLPHFHATTYYGSGRSLEAFKEVGDVLLTSYGTLRSEVEAISKLEFDIAIYDEAQIAKNPRSQTHKILKKLSAHMRLGLSGTPIENRLIELKALFDIVLPGYMPSETVYRESFVRPIEKGESSEARTMLTKLIRPFILRRKKSEVLQDLPAKTEEISYCLLSPEQKTLYQAVFAQSKKTILEELKDPHKPVPYVHIFSILSALKQICDHPCLHTKKLDNFEEHASGKWELFVELIDEARESGQKVVVFSQYLDMLTMMERYLKRKKIGFAGIRGSTRNRKEELDRFKEDPACEVFLASLQAAGVGVDLVSASIVIHYDRWWNPAKENQATDRVHRIGQSRGVQVFKMVTKGTIEERIHELIEKKMGLAESVMGGEDDEPLQHLNREELLQIFQLAESDLTRYD